MRILQERDSGWMEAVTLATGTGGWNQCQGPGWGRSSTSRWAGAGASQEGQGPPEGHIRSLARALPYPG